VLFVPLLGALIVVWLFYYYIAGTVADAGFIDLASRQRMLSEQIFYSAEAVLRGDNDRIAFLESQINDFDHVLNILIEGGSAMGHELSPAKPEILQSLVDVSENWMAIRLVMKLIVNK